jgi:hypothetical protein
MNMTNPELLNTELVKWPGLIVVGDKVTEDEASEIIIRTNEFSFYCNDLEWQRQLNGVIYGIEAAGTEYGDRKDLSELLGEMHGRSKNDITFDTDRRICNIYLGKYERLNLHYLQNDKIATSYSGGPRGWCDWDGSIGASSYNIGKRPSCTEVYDEWKIIAEAFPFLNLRCQLINIETGEDDEEQIPVIEYVILNGAVDVIKPNALLKRHEYVHNAKSHLDPTRERGCTIEKFKESLIKTETSVKTKKDLAIGQYFELIEN